MTGVPDYISPFAYDIKTTKDEVSFRVQCTCGCRTFALRKNTFSAEEKRILDDYAKALPKIRWHTVWGGIGEDGQPYHYIRRFFFFKKYLELPPPPFFANIRTVKAVCESCKKKIVLFDSRLHGCDAMEASEEERQYVPSYNEQKTDYCGVSVKLEQLEDEELDARYFSGIQIYRIMGSKTLEFFEAETV